MGRPRGGTPTAAELAKTNPAGMKSAIAMPAVNAVVVIVTAT
jgi:hypothetical protein